MNQSFFLTSIISKGKEANAKKDFRLQPHADYLLKFKTDETITLWLKF